MKTLVCGHVAVSGESRVCRHLFGIPETEIAGFFRVLVGDGMRCEFRCGDCAKNTAAAVFEVCEGCVVRIEEDGDTLGWRGEPGILERPEPCGQPVVATPLPAELGDVVDVAPVTAQPGVWLALSRDGRISRWDCASGSTAQLVVSTVPDESERDESFKGQVVVPRLHASADGRFAAVVNDFGRHGALFDLDAGRVTLVLHGGDYCEETVPFSFAFVEHAGRTVAVHRTEWNRLDVSDPATGALLSERVVERPERDKPRPEHYLDYFHGALLASPGGTWMADDGWVWHPIGIPMTWSLEQWLGGAKWEAEDGPSLCRLAWRAYRWNNPMCWLDETHLVLGGIGDDDEAMLDGVEIFHAETGARTGVFAGPSGRFFVDGRRLYSAAASGLEIWDPDTGERTGGVPGFVPTHQHAGSGELAALADGALLRWSTAGHQP